jgi:beta-catenin-like protein 1
MSSKPTCDKFLPAPTFSGAKPGYAFKMGAFGVGYYYDMPSSSDTAKRSFPSDIIGSPESKRRKPNIDAAAEIEEFSEETFKANLSSLERTFMTNEEKRIKYCSDPQKFMESELKLHECMETISAVSAYPHLYHIMVEQNAATLFSSLLMHPNIDVCLNMIEILQEILDPSIVTDEDEHTHAFFILFLKVGGLKALAESLARMDQGGGKREEEGVESILTIIETMFEYSPEDVSQTFLDSPLLFWLLGRINHKRFDSNKLAASEILFMFLQASKKNRLHLKSGTAKSVQSQSNDQEPETGIEKLLKAIHFYRKRNPGSLEEEECVENLFSCVACMLLEPANQTIFAELDGFELIVKILRCRMYTYRKCWQVLDAAMTEHSANCERFVQADGLKVLFPAFMGLGKINTGKSGKVKLRTAVRTEDEECILSIMTSLMRHLQDVSYARLLRKFCEKDHDKLSRLFQLLNKYEQVCAKSSWDGAAGGASADQLGGGRFALQRIALLIARFNSEVGASYESMHAYIMKSTTPSAALTIKNMMSEYLDILQSREGELNPANDGDAQKIVGRAIKDYECWKETIESINEPA